MIEYNGRKYIKIEFENGDCTGCAFKDEAWACTAPDYLHCVDMATDWIFKEIKEIEEIGREG